MQTPVSYTHLDVYKRQFIECIVPKFTELSKNNSNGKSLTNIKKTGGSILKINKDRKNDDE